MLQSNKLSHEGSGNLSGQRLKCLMTHALDISMPKNGIVVQVRPPTKNSESVPAMYRQLPDNKALVMIGMSSSAKANAGHRLDTTIDSKFGSNLTRSGALRRHSFLIAVQRWPSLVKLKMSPLRPWLLGGVVCTP